MKKLKRSARLVDMTQYLMLRPHTLIPLTTFSERYLAAKSSISEDLVIIKEVLAGEEAGELVTTAGVAGGVTYKPGISRSSSLHLIKLICRQLAEPDRILPGDYLYMSDILGQPMILNDIGKMFASAFAGKDIDVVMTVETKGIPLAVATASSLNLPIVTVRRDNKGVTEGSVVSIHYVSGSTRRLQTMSLARRALQEQAKVLIIDDFMKAGGTIHGMMDLLKEFKATVAGIGVFVESRNDLMEYLVDDYVSLIKLSGVDLKTKQISVSPGNYFE